MAYAHHGYSYSSPGYFGPSGTALNSPQSQYGGAPTNYGGGGGAPAGGGPSVDPQRLWDLGQLQNKLNDMQFAVAATDEALAYKDGGTTDRGLVGDTGGAFPPHTDSGAGDILNSNADRGPQQAAAQQQQRFFDEFGNAVSSNPGAVFIDTDMLPVTEGWVHIKGVREGAFQSVRAWRQRFARLDGTDLAFYVTAEDPRPRGHFSLDAQSSIAPGDANKVHKNKNVKYDLDIANGRGEVLSLYCETEEEARDWIYTLQFVITRLAEAAVAAESGGGSGALLAGGDAEGAGGSDRFGAGGSDRLWAAMPPESSGGSPGGRSDAFYGGGGGQFGGGSPQQQLGGGGGFDGEGTPGRFGNVQQQQYGGGGNPLAALTDEELDRLRDEAQAHTAYGPGLYEGVRGEPTYFSITANDLASGGPKGVGGDVFAVSIANAELHFDLAPVDNGDGTYFVEFTPTRAGEYTLSVTFCGQDIYGSPFHPAVSSARTAASHCIVEGEGTKTVSPAAPAAFTVTTRDQFDDLRGTGGDNFEVTIVGPGLANPILDNGDGTYSVSFDVDTEARAYREYVAAVAATEGGKGVAPLALEVHVTLNNDGFPYPRPIAGSPFRPRVTLPKEVLAAAEAELAAASAEAARAAAAATAAAVRASPATAAATTSTAATGGGDAFSPSTSPTTLLPAGVAVSSSGGGTSTDGALTAAAASAAMAQVEAMRASLVAREAAVAEGQAALEEARRAMEADRRALEAQMARMTELGRTVKEDSERLAEQARSLRAVAAMTALQHAAAAPVQQQQQQQSPLQQRQQQLGASPSHGSVAGSASRASLRALSPQPSAAEEDGASVATGSIARGYAAAAGAVVAPSSSPPPPSDASPVAAAYNASSGDAPPELFEPEVMALFDRYKKPLFELWQHYGALSSAAAAARGGGDALLPSGVDAKRFVALFCDFDIAPTFLTKRELKAIFSAAARAHASAGEDAESSATGDGGTVTTALTTSGGALAGPLSYAAFMEALGRTALAALSKPAFTHLYPSARDKCAVLFEMWGVADARKLAEITRRA